MASNEVERARKFIESIRSGGAPDPRPSSLRPLTLGEGRRREPHSGRAPSIEKGPEECPVRGRWRDETSQGGPGPRGGKRVERIHWEDASGNSGVFEVPLPVAKAFGKRERSFVSLEELHDVLDELSAKGAFDGIVKMLDRQERCADEVMSRLSGQGFDRSHIQAAIDRATRCGLLDEARYVEAYISAKTRKGWGRRRIERELAQRGIDPGLVERHWGLSAPTESELERAKRVLRGKAVPANEPQVRLARFLVGRGFDYTTAMDAARFRIEEVRTELAND